MASTPSPDTASVPPPPTDESSIPPPADDSSSSPPTDNTSPPPPQEQPSDPPPSASPPPASPPPSEESSPPPPSAESSPPNDSSQSPPAPSDNGSLPPPSPSQPDNPNPPPSSNHNNSPPSTFSPPHHSPGKVNPSPPPPRKISPSSNDGSSSSSNGSDNAAFIAGLAIAGVLILAIIIISVMCCCSRKKKRKPYYMDPGRRPPPGGNYYQGSAGNPWHSPQPTDHVVKLPPPPAGGGGWGAPPPPPLPGHPSGEFSSAFSGPHGQHHMPLPPQSPNVGNMGLGFSKSQFTYEDLAAATSGFAQANLLGQGGFGYVHKGVLPNGQIVAVKSLKSGSGQGEREFQAEVEIISRVHHRHLVSLVGYCIADSQRMLVYEFVPNSTLEFHLHGKGQPVMDFSSRMRIAMGSAKGLAYLHEDCHPRIIHRDIKAANILLDDNYEAMVADFGLAKLSSDNFTHVSTRVMGTFGYLAPEYASSGKLSDKSDVFSFGVMLLELITGKRPVDPNNYMEDSLVDWARPLLEKAIQDGDYSELVDPRLENNFFPNEMARLVTCAAASIRHSARRRPRMSQIVRALEGDASLDDLNESGVKPGRTQSSISSSNQGGGVLSYDTCEYNADMMKFRKMVLDSGEVNSSIYGATSEYGLNPSSSSSEEGNSGPQRQKL